MNPKINRILICKETKREMYDSGDMLFFPMGEGYRSGGCYVSELSYGSSTARDIIREVGLSRADIRWIEKTARELFNDKNNDNLEINMKTMKMHKY